MKNFSYVTAAALLFASVTLAPILALGQTQALMPTLYNASGQAVNVNNTMPLPAGYYYLGVGQTGQVYYYGNGTYYNAATGMYGGNAISDPYGVAGVALNYSATVAQATTPTAPNTGAGGDSLAAWMILAVSGLAVVAGLAYLTASNRTLKLG